MVTANWIPKNKPGIYVITDRKLNNKKKGRYKVGMSINLKKRLDNYHTCWPSKKGYWVYNLIILKKNVKVINFEKRLHTFLRKYPEIINLEMNSRVRKTEWYKSQLNVMKIAMRNFVLLNQGEVEEHIYVHNIIDNIQ